MLRKKSAVTALKDITAFFVELVSRAREFHGRSVRIHFIADNHPEHGSFSSDIGEFLPFLRTALIDAAQNIAPNPRTFLYTHAAADSSPAALAARVAEGIVPDGDEFFIITLGEPEMQKDVAQCFAGLSVEAKKHITLLHLPCGNLDTRAKTNALVSVVRILIKGERISLSADGLRILQEKT